MKAIAAALVAAVLATSGPAGAQTKVSVGLGMAPTLIYGAHYLALGKGFFKEEGLDVEYVVFDGTALDGVVWLANHRSQRFGEGLRAGDIVSTGSLTGIHWTKPGAVAVADSGSLGSVTVTLAGHPPA